ncbi:hypothetical protein TB2_030060 [Malus domestica]
MFDLAENNRLPLRKSFRACPSRRPVVIPNIDLVDYAYQFECYPHQCKMLINYFFFAVLGTIYIEMRIYWEHCTTDVLFDL